MNATCINEPGSYSCHCKDGFFGNGFSCNDINECEDRLQVCSVGETCINTAGSFVCSSNRDGDKCMTGYRSGENGITGCIDINECEENSFSCPENSICTNTIGTYLCQCKEGFTQIGNSCQRIECPAGQYAPDGITCKNCPPNTYNSVADNSLSECSPCPPLHSTPVPGASSITQCRSKMILTAPLLAFIT